MSKKFLLVGLIVALLLVNLGFAAEAQKPRLLGQSVASLLGTTIGGLEGGLLGF
jgi:hypothetical protein